MQVLNGEKLGYLRDAAPSGHWESPNFFFCRHEDLDGLDPHFRAGNCRVITDEEYDRMRGV